jgi:hypothetical protein
VPGGNPGWVPGKSGNPKGRPRRGDTFADLLEKELRKRKYTAKSEDGTEKRVNGKQAIIQAHLALIFKKDISPYVKIQAIDSLYNRCDGSPQQRVEHSGVLETSEVHVYIPDNGRGDGPAPKDPDA